MDVIRYTLLLMVTSMAAQSTYGQCRVLGQASFRSGIDNNCWNCAVGETEFGFGRPWDDTEIYVAKGSELGTGFGYTEGTDLVFKGRPQAGGMFYGLYPSLNGTKTAIHASFQVSIDWAPDSYRYCAKHEFKVLSQSRRCKRHETGYHPTSFLVDITTNVGQVRHYVKQFTNINKTEKDWIDMPMLECDGPINKFEIRIVDLSGGNVDFRVHQGVYRKYYQW